MAIIIDKRAEEAQKLQEFRQKFPCCTCKFGKICKFKDTMEMVEIPEYFHLDVTCEYQVELNQPQESGNSDAETGE